MKLQPFDLARTPLDAGTRLLEASAGTGKTYTLVGILLRLLLEGRIERLDQALVVTFTVAATDELKNRLRDALRAVLRAVHEPVGDPFFRGLAALPGAERIVSQALADFDQVGIATIHGFCKRLLEETAFETHEPFAFEFTPDPLPLLHRAAADALRLQYEPGITAGSAVVRHSKFAPSTLVDAYRLWRRHPDVALVPARPDLAGQLDAVATALAGCQRTLDDDAVARIAAIVWKGTPLLDASDPAALPRLVERTRASPALTVPILVELAPSADRVHSKQTSRTWHSHPFFAACEALRGAVTTAVEHLRSTLLQAMHARVERGKRDDHVLTFDDLLVRVHQALQDPDRRPTLLAALRTRYTVGLIDEFQDTDSLQYRIFADCFAGRTLFLVGDPKQSIYGFRGADLRAYLQARDDAAGHYTLAVNHRSAAALVAAVGQLFSAQPRPFVDDRIAMPDVRAAARPGALTIVGDGDAVLRWRFVPFLDDSRFPCLAAGPAEELVARDVAAEAARLLRSPARRDRRELRPRDLAVLTRTNDQATAVQAALREAGIPSAIGKAGDIFQTDELAELQRFLYAVLHPHDLRRVRAAMCTRLWGFDAARLVALEQDQAGFDRELERLRRWRWLWLRCGYVVMQEQALVDLDVHSRLLACHAGERRLTNFRQLFELLHDAEHTHRLSPEGLLAWLLHERQNQDDLDYTLRELRLESDEDAAQILTVHGSKGLQYEVVFCPFLWDAKGPRGNDLVPTDAGHELVFGLKKEHPRHAAVAEERLAEELRLAYVALTRARRRCYVHWGGLTRNVFGSALTWLLLGGEPRTAGGGASGAADWLDAWTSRMKDDRARWFDALDALVARSNGTMSLSRLDAVPPVERLQAPPAADLVAPRRATRIVRAHGLHSFSSLIAPDHDLEPVLAPEVPAAPPPAAPAPGLPRGIFAFARGPAAGQCLHTILERIDFAAVAAPAARAVVHEVLTAHGLADPAAHDGELDPVADVHGALQQLAAATAFPGGPTIGRLCSGTRQVEWQFALPTASADVHRLADAFAASTSVPARAQADRLRALPPQLLRGFLVGFVDLVAAHDGRHHVLDWKSNHLGNDASAYASEALLPVMVAHDYVLQYHLYVLALHRHLRARLRDYDYERHVGEVVYAFLRGALPASTCGMFADRVPAALVAAMDRWADGQDAGARR